MVETKYSRKTTYLFIILLLEEPNNFGQSAVFLIFCQVQPQTILRDRLHELGLDANPGQYATPGDLFSSQTFVTVYMDPDGGAHVNSLEKG